MAVSGNGNENDSMGVGREWEQESHSHTPLTLTHTQTGFNPQYYKLSQIIIIITEFIVQLLNVEHRCITKVNKIKIKVK